MTRHRAENPIVNARPTLARLTTAVLLSGLAVAIMSAPTGANAQVIGQIVPRGNGGGDHGFIKSGNGRDNHNHTDMFSPTINNGVQHVASVSVGGDAPTQTGLCKRRHRVCKIVQKQRIHRSRTDIGKRSR